MDSSSVVTISTRTQHKAGDLPSYFEASVNSSFSYNSCTSANRSAASAKDDRDQSRIRI